MCKIFRQELQQLGDDIVCEARATATAIEKAARALREANLVLAEQVIDADQHIDLLERAVDEAGISLLARQAPVASDLRNVVAALRLSATLERMGDLARHVAYVARGRFPHTAVQGEIRTLVETMAAQATKVAKNVVELLETHNLALAARIEEDDEILDELHARSFELLLNESIDLSRQHIIDTVLLCRYLERFGDHGVSVARRVSFLVTGNLDNAVVFDVSDDAAAPAGDTIGAGQS